eukprot:CAMPEP_0194111396 /NCGR_PEP_ID=MMETSP0150-20130528/10405_1 /TAXON_ID=122233 /ORGANISM="Chaetoceros debilis, Strain MM31A-1" /LENGTH=328 /DNA_ID=CAMNT_0038800813 /DNA_START=124 /DNA_END=1110 /DNA_ORIENTATION=+
MAFHFAMGDPSELVQIHNVPHYRYLGSANEDIPWDVSHIIVDNSVTIIKKNAFSMCQNIESVIMGDSVRIIEAEAFFKCINLEVIRLSKSLQRIGERAFCGCEELQVFIIPPSVKEIERWILMDCPLLRFLVLPYEINLDHVGEEIIFNTPLCDFARDAGVQYEMDRNGIVTEESNRRFHEWLFCRTEPYESPLHKICYKADVTVQEINDYICENGDESASQMDAMHGITHGMTLLHMLAMNSHAAADVVAGNLLHANMDAVFLRDDEGETPLDYAARYNVPGLLKIIEILCLHRQTTFTKKIIHERGSLYQKKEVERIRKRKISEMV